MSSTTHARSTHRGMTLVVRHATHDAPGDRRAPDGSAYESFRAAIYRADESLPADVGMELRTAALAEQDGREMIDRALATPAAPRGRSVEEIETMPGMGRDD